MSELVNVHSRPKSLLGIRHVIGSILFALGIYVMVSGLFQDGMTRILVGLFITGVGTRILLSRSNREASQQAEKLIRI